MQVLGHGGFPFIRCGDLAQAGGGLEGDAARPAVLDMFGDQAWLARAALWAGEVMQHEIFDYR